MSSALAAFEAAQSAQLRALRTPDSGDRTMLAQLLETSCLLELSKLASAKLDLASYLQMAVEALSQFFPSDACVLRVHINGLPEMRASFGTPPEDEQQLLDAALADELGAYRDAGATTLRLGAVPIGLMVLSASGGVEVGPDFATRAAEQISTGLEVVVERERLRRQAAASWATKIAASIDERCEVSHFEDLVNALASLPNAIGAEMHIQTPLVPGPIRVRAGTVTESAGLRRKMPEAGLFDLWMTWASGPREQDSAVIDEVVETLADALERALRNRRLLEQAETDPLTGIGNRRRIERSLRAALNRADRYDEPVAVVLLDLDHFKQVNDILGHDVGDEVLKAFAAMLEDGARAYDTVARLGGEEFIVVCPTTDAMGAEALAERLREQTPVALASALPEGWRQTASVGVAVFPENADGIPSLLRVADDALYRAKRGGRDRVEVAPHGS